MIITWFMCRRGLQMMKSYESSITSRWFALVKYLDLILDGVNVLGVVGILISMSRVDELETNHN